MTKHEGTILVLEDERQIARAIGAALTERGFRTIVVSTVADGLRSLAQEKKIDVIWLDHYLLGAENGLDFVIKLKNHKEWRQIPVFVVSNDTSSSNIHSYMQIGVTNYYTKADYDISQIIADIEYAITSGGNNSPT